MIIVRTNKRPAATVAAASTLGVMALGVLALSGCDLKVVQPDIASAASVNAPAARVTLLNGAVSLLTAGYAGNGDNSGLASLGGLLTDEFLNSDYQDRHIDVDKRNVPENSTAVQTMYANLQRARVAGEDVAARYAASEPNSVHGAEAELVAAYSYLVFAESFCNGVPYSTLSASGSPVYGTPETSAQSYTRALTHFANAITIASRAGAANSDVADVLNAARVGRGRTLLGQGQYAAAAAAVAAVTTPSFHYDLFASSGSSTQNNGVFAWNNNYGRFTAADRESGEGLNFLSANDPRTPYQDAGRFGLDARTPLVFQEKYPDYASSTVLASYTEAELIRAEADLQAGSANWLTRLNTLRAGVGLSALVDPSLGSAQGPTKARVALLFRERAFWLWLSGHRSGDLRRQLRQYASFFPSQAEIYPTGVYVKGGNYGTDVVFKVPFDERNNPNYAKLATTCSDFNP